MKPELFTLCDYAVAVPGGKLTIVGTFMTRSGVVQSVHAFGSDPVLAWTFAAFMLVIVVFSFGLLIWRIAIRAMTKKLID